MTVTLAGYVAQAEDRRRTAEQEQQAANAAFARWRTAVEALGGEGAADDQMLARGDGIARRVQEAKNETRRAEAALAEARRIAAEEDQYQQRSREIHPVQFRDAGGRGETTSYAIGGGSREVGDGPGPLVYRHGPNDMRPAAVGRGQPLADHPVVAEQIARAAVQDQHVIGMHGGLGSMIRAMSTTSGSAVVPSIWASTIIDKARNLSACVQAGAEIVPMDAKIVQIGRLAADPSAGFRAEGSTITASDPTFDNVTLTATTLSALVIGSLEWFQDVTPGGGADQLVSEALAKRIAEVLDQACLMGGITAGGEGVNLPNPPNPRGILASLLAVAPSSVLGSATNGTSQTAATFYKEVLDTIYTPRDFNEAPNAMIWPSRLARVYAEAADTTNQPLRQPPAVEQITKFMSNNVPSGFGQGTGTTMADLFVGDFHQLLIGQRLDLQIQTLTERYAEQGQVGILATWRGDVQLARPRAFACFRYLKGV
jgi:HK97 family phage major capsid protein